MAKRKYTIEELLAPPAEGQVDQRVDRLEGQFDRATANKDQRTVDMSFSSEVPVERYYGKEILSHDPGAVDLTRLGSGRANVLVNHDPGDWVGVIEQARVDPKAKVGRATVRFGNSPRANEVFRDVSEGILSSVSVGYRRDEMKLSLTDDTGDEYTVTRWTPFEVSLVTIPADETVGVGRAAELLRNQPAAPAAPKEHIMTPEEQAAAAAAARNKLTAVEAEKQRRQAVINYCKASKVDPRVEARWIEEGTSLEEISSEILKVLEERGKQKSMNAAALGLSSSETRNYSLFRAIRAMRFGAQSPAFMQEAGFELECSREVAKRLGRQQTSSMLIPVEVLSRPLGKEAAERAMSVVPGAKGGYMVSIDQMGFIDILRNRSVAMAMGARVLSGLQGNVTFPRQTGKPTVTWQGGEGVSVTAADQTLGQLSMTPKTCIAITDVSEQLLAQASPSAEAFVMADLAADVAIDGIDAATINGTGGAQPLGIKNTTGITSGQDAASATYAKILAFVSTAGGVNAILGNPGWVTNTAGAAKLMQVQRFSSTDTPLWAGNMLNGLCVGFNAMSSEQLASGNLVFGSWDQLVIGEWGVLELSMDNGGTRFNQAQVGIRALWMVDVLLRYPQAFVVSTNLS
ncbi:MAG TPA: phage major capsid protein [Burkholderiales bacterium]|nr:phage major capsid protein [Burkholderiales bacterium]